MKVYFLVEGKRTEIKIYPAWLSYLVPQLTRIKRYDDPAPNSYYILSGEGYPSIIQDHIPNAIADINRVGGYNYLVVCLDADEGSVQDRIDEINSELVSKRISLTTTELKIIVQNRCIETWFLGNRRIINRNATNLLLRRYLDHYNVRVDDPEIMPKYQGFSTHAAFHFKYIKEIFEERKKESNLTGLTYSKKDPGDAQTLAFLKQLITRVEDEPKHLISLQEFFSFCSQLRTEIDLGY